MVLFSHTDEDDVVYYHCLLTPYRLSIKLKCGVGKTNNCTLASESQKQVFFKSLKNYGYTYNTIKDCLEKVINKFDVINLKQFDKVLVRYNNNNVWHAAYFSHYDPELEFGCFPFVVTGGKSYPMCILYNDDTKHLIGTKKDCDEYYQVW